MLGRGGGDEFTGHIDVLGRVNSDWDVSGSGVVASANGERHG